MKLRCGLTYPKYEIVKVHTGVLPTNIISYFAKSVKFPNFLACAGKHGLNQYLFDIIKHIRIGIGGKDSFYIAAIDDKANRVFLSVYIGNPYTSFVLIQYSYLQRYGNGLYFVFRAAFCAGRQNGEWQLGQLLEAVIEKTIPADNQYHSEFAACVVLE